MIAHAFYQQSEPRLRGNWCSRKNDREAVLDRFTLAFYSLKADIGTVIDIIPMDVIS